MRGYAATLPVAFSAAQQRDLRRFTRTAQSFALEMSTQEGIESVVRSYVTFCRACGMPVRFTFNLIAGWLAELAIRKTSVHQYVWTCEHAHVRTCEHASVPRSRSEC